MAAAGLTLIVLAFLVSVFLPDEKGRDVFIEVLSWVAGCGAILILISTITVLWKVAP